jgi:hypothetical protein
MWLFTRYGFYSVTVSKKEPHKMQIRARAEQDLERLVELAGKYGWSANLGEIIETPQADYRYRLICSPKIWQDLAGVLAAEIDYSNFKNEITDPVRHRIYEQVWHAMLNVQYREEAERLQQRFGLFDLLDDDPITQEDLPGWDWDDDTPGIQNELIDDDPTSPFYDPGPVTGRRLESGDD